MSDYNELLDQEAAQISCPRKYLKPEVEFTSLLYV